jgi:DNA-binding response OmpR family regulator
MDRHILIADDNKDIAALLSAYVAREGYSPILAYDGNEAMEKYRAFNPVLILLDIMMPKKDGFEVCREIRKESNVPVIMITSKGEDSDKIMGLDTGADDYIVKPFSPGEVMARIKAVLRRVDVTDEQKSEVIKFKDLEINIGEYSVKLNGKQINITKKEIEILWLLAKRPNRVFSRDILLDRIWGYDYYGDARTVDTHIKRLRAKLQLPKDFPWDIKTVWGVGYKFEVNNE